MLLHSFQDYAHLQQRGSLDQEVKHKADHGDLPMGLSHRAL